MSKATKRKHVLMEVLQDDFNLPNENQQIVKVLCSRGNNLHEVQTPSNENFLVSMPTKFRKNIWVKRGDFILVEPIAEGDKVKAEIVRILTNEHIKEFKKAGVWPEEFSEKKLETSNGDDELFVNTNRVNLIDDGTESSSESSSSDDEEEE